MSVFRIYVEKKPEYAVEAKSVLNDIQTALRLNISGVRILNRYDADKLSRAKYNNSHLRLPMRPTHQIDQHTIIHHYE